MRRLSLTIALLVFLSSDAFAMGPIHIWSRHFTATTWAGVMRVVTDASNNIYALGGFTGTIDFGGGPRTSTGNSDNFVVSFDANGAYRWDIVYPDAVVWSMDLDPNGGLVIAGDFAGSLDLGGTVLTSAGDLDYFVAKLGTDGQYGWRKRYGTLGDQSCRAIACDANGNIGVTGQHEYANPYWGEYFVAKLDAAGNELWMRRVFEDDYQCGVAIDFDASGNVVVGVHYLYAPDFGGGPVIPAGARINIAVVKYTPDGTFLWSRGFGDSDQQALLCLAVDASDRIWLTGSFLGSVGFGGGTFFNRNNDDMFLAVLDANGQHHASRQFNAGDDYFYDFQIGRSIAFDAAGDAVIAGYFAAKVDLGGGDLVSDGNWNAFVARFSPDLDHVWSRSYGITSNTWAQAVAVDDAGDLIVAGWFDGSVDFGGGVFPDGPGQEMFLAKFTDDTFLPVLFTRFAAIARGASVHVEWELAHDESMDSFTLYRNAEGSDHADVIATGDAMSTGSFTDVDVQAGRTYQYELVVRTTDGDLFRSPTSAVTLPAITTSLGPNHPNPFNPTTTIEYAVGETMPVTIEIFDVSGALVTRLNQGMREPGTYRAEWDGRDAAGHAMGSGVYFYQMSGVPRTAHKMVLLK